MPIGATESQLIPFTRLAFAICDFSRLDSAPAPQMRDRLDATIKVAVPSSRSEVLLVMQALNVFHNATLRVQVHHSAFRVD